MSEQTRISYRIRINARHLNSWSDSDALLTKTIGNQNLDNVHIKDSNNLIFSNVRDYVSFYVSAVNSDRYELQIIDGFIDGKWMCGSDFYKHMLINETRLDPHTSPNDKFGEPVPRAMDNSYTVAESWNIRMFDVYLEVVGEDPDKCETGQITLMSAYENPHTKEIYYTYEISCNDGTTLRSVSDYVEKASKHPHIQSETGGGWLCIEIEIDGLWHRGAAVSYDLFGISIENYPNGTYVEIPPNQWPSANEISKICIQE